MPYNSIIGKDILLMKKLLLLIPLTFLSIPAPIQAQQVTVYQSCIGEVYFPGYYDQYGNFVAGGVSRTRVPCGGGGGYQQQRTCNPEAGALLGAGIAGAIVGGDTHTYTNTWNNNRTRNGDSGSSTYTSSKNNYWQALGAGAGALMFGC